MQIKNNIFWFSQSQGFPLKIIKKLQTFMYEKKKSETSSEIAKWFLFSKYTIFYTLLKRISLVSFICTENEIYIDPLQLLIKNYDLFVEMYHWNETSSKDKIKSLNISYNFPKWYLEIHFSNKRNDLRHLYS